MIEQTDVEKPKDKSAQQPIKVVDPADLRLLDTNLVGSEPPAWIGKALKWALPLAILLFVALIAIPGLLKQWLWMDQVNYVGIFWTVLWIKWGITCVAFLAAFVFIWINLRQAAINSLSLLQAGRKSALAHDKKGITLGGFLIPHHVLSGSTALVTGAIALLFATGFYSQWDTFLRFYYGGSFGLPDPVFGADLSFYMFRLPWYQLVQSSLLFLTGLTICAVVLQYVYFGILRFAGRQTLVTNKPAAQHVTGLLFISSALFAWGYYLDRFNLMYSKTGVVFGVGYTEDHVTIVALWSMIGISIIACALLILNFLRPNWKAVSIGVLTYAGLYVLGVVAIPALVQSFIVKPNELKLETPYLNNFISFTRKAYNLEAIQETSYPALTDLTPDVIARNEDTIQNIRLWDKRPLLQTYQQTQAIRLYYDFYNVDVDRYHLSDGYHQVMLATRELSPTLPAQAQTWVNENLQFTHGFGLVMNFVSKSIGGGFPQYLIDNVPPQSSYGLNVSQPGIYYGEAMAGSRIVATGVKEFDYPKGNENVYTSYHGKGGVPLDSFGKRLLFAWTQADINILLTSYLKPESRIQIYRNVKDRVTQIAPFLKLDADPYAVLSEGKLYWIQDAYTTSDHFPYSNPYHKDDALGDGLNYIRNSVKAVVNMYDGTVSFYVMDPHDPVLAAYQRAFPGVFANLDQISPDLKLHLRYPQDLFEIQATQYETFHMTDPQVFYNREDLWVPPLEKYDGKVGPMEPYYILMKLPGSDVLEYLLMSPFTPEHRDNMISWLAARSDFPAYGKMLFYELPKDKLTYGPNQVSAMIDQSTLISQQLTLWDQKGSGVIRGKLVVIPIENSFLYVIPLYLRAEGTNFPQLKRVIAATGDRVVMEPTLDEAVAALFGNSPAVQQTGNGTPQAKPDLNQIQLQLGQAQKAITALEQLLKNPAVAPPSK
jgi:uncharacterized membrane protein (UPF0182 family)